jgi:hypothetical protein
MRALLDEYGPIFSHYYGIRPWEHGRLKIHQIHALIRNWNQTIEKMEGG